MDEQDGQDKRTTHEAITSVVIGCAFEVINELGTGFLESVYEKALLLALRQRGLLASGQQAIKVMFRNECVGDFYADILVEERVIVELKTAKAGTRIGVSGYDLEVFWLFCTSMFFELADTESDQDYVSDFPRTQTLTYRMDRIG